MCQVMQALTGGQVSNSMLSTVSQAIQVISAAHNAANTAQNLGSIASIISQYASGSGSQNNLPPTDTMSNSNKSIFAQILNILSAMTGGTTSPLTSSTSLSSPSSQSNYSPLTAILDYLASSSPNTLSSILPARRKKPLDFDDIANEALPVTQIPPTPCPSIEEYVAPVYARNYQGVWKYVVQIPHEGYFTQTVQKTACAKNRCDFMEGVCHESPRWVSLLVSEIFYTQPLTSVTLPSSSSTVTKAQKPSSSTKPQQLQNTVYHLNYNNALDQNPIKVDFHTFDRYVNRNGNYRQGDEDFAPQHDDTLAKPRSFSNAQENEVNSRTSDANEEECDSYDQNGCYVVRVYYDWFLVPGACKCWRKSSHSSSLEALKKTFIGK